MSGPRRRLTIGALTLSVCLALSAAAVAMSTVEAASAGRQVPNDQPHGVNFLVKSGVDTNFCMQGTWSGPGTQVVTQVCNGGVDGQPWVFANTVAGPVVALSTSGYCWDASSTVGSVLRIALCTFKGTEQFVFVSSTQQFQNAAGSRCLTVPSSGLLAGKQVKVEKCDATNKGQTWIFGH